MLSLMSGNRLELFARGGEIARASRLLSHHEKSPAVGRGLEARYLPRRVSFRPPTAFCTLPAALSDLPSASSLASPVTLPATSLMAPLACLAEPSSRSLSISIAFRACGLDQLRSGSEVQLIPGVRPNAHAHLRVRTNRLAHFAQDSGFDVVEKLERGSRHLSIHSLPVRACA